MTLREKQSEFARATGALIQHVFAEGYECTLDWVYRPPEVAAYYASLGIGIRNSLHTLKLAIDINLFRDGKWLRHTEDHRALGLWWEHSHPLARWGGHFGDGNHYSFEHEGKK